MQGFISIHEIPWQGRRCLVRTDYNVPLNPDGSIEDDFRIRASLPTLDYLLSRGASVIIMSHVGRPKGQYVASLNLSQIRRRLQNLLKVKVEDLGCVEEAARNLRSTDIGPGKVGLLDNLRFSIGEEKNSPSFANALANLGNLYVNDAFGVSHRAHASIAGLPRLMSAMPGLLMEKEITSLTEAVEDGPRPSVLMVGGAKISDKIGVVVSLGRRMDSVLIGGGMTVSFLKSKKFRVGVHTPQETDVQMADKAFAELGKRLQIPLDVIGLCGNTNTGQPYICNSSSIPDDMKIMDIGPKTRKLYMSILKQANKIVWNGPMGVIECNRFAKGTDAVATTVAQSQAEIKIGGGGSTLTVLGKLGLRDRFSHLSTGGGAMLEFMEGKELPGLTALKNAGRETLRE